MNVIVTLSKYLKDENRFFPYYDDHNYWAQTNQNKS
jgi:hypothetical protein